MIIKQRTISIICLLTLGLNIIATPLMYSGKTINSIIIMELTGLFLLFMVVISGVYKGKILNSVRIFIFFSLTILTIYVVPLPEDWWSNISGRKQYIEVINWIENTSEIRSYKALSLIPLHSLSVLLSCIPALAIFILTISASKADLKIILYILLISATIQATLGFFQHFDLAQLLNNFPIIKNSHDSLTQGTYLNRNHFAVFMLIIEPITIAMIAHIITRPEAERRQLKQHIKLITLSFISLMLTFTAFATTSRMGNTLLLISTLFLFSLFSFGFTSPHRLKRKIIVYTTYLKLTLLIVIFILGYESLTTTIDRISPESIAGDARWDMYEAAWNGTRNFFPFGSGPGTMPQILPAFLTPEIGFFQEMFVNHAHNDYLEFVFETGLFGLIIIFYFSGLYIYQWYRINQQKHEDTQITLLQSAAGIGILLYLLSGLTTFTFHTPANLYALMILCGVFFRKSVQVHSPVKFINCNSTIG